MPELALGPTWGDCLGRQACSGDDASANAPSLYPLISSFVQSFGAMPQIWAGEEVRGEAGGASVGPMHTARAAGVAPLHQHPHSRAMGLEHGAQLR